MCVHVINILDSWLQEIQVDLSLMWCLALVNRFFIEYTTVHMKT